LLRIRLAVSRKPLRMLRHGLSSDRTIRARTVTLRPCILLAAEAEPGKVVPLAVDGEDSPDLHVVIGDEPLPPRQTSRAQATSNVQVTRADFTLEQSYRG
jgi:hypothetical protein